MTGTSRRSSRGAWPLPALAAVSIGAAVFGTLKVGYRRNAGSTALTAAPRWVVTIRVGVAALAGRC